MYTHFDNAFHNSLASVPDRLKGENELLRKKLEWSEKKRL